MTTKIIYFILGFILIQSMGWASDPQEEVSEDQRARLTSTSLIYPDTAWERRGLTVQEAEKYTAQLFQGTQDQEENIRKKEKCLDLFLKLRVPESSIENLLQYSHEMTDFYFEKIKNRKTANSYSGSDSDSEYCPEEGENRKYLIDLKYRFFKNIASVKPEQYEVFKNHSKKLIERAPQYIEGDIPSILKCLSQTPLKERQKLVNYFLIFFIEKTTFNENTQTVYRKYGNTAIFEHQSHNFTFSYMLKKILTLKPEQRQPFLEQFYRLLIQTPHEYIHKTFENLLKVRPQEWKPMVDLLLKSKDNRRFLYDKLKCNTLLQSVCDFDPDKRPLLLKQINEFVEAADSLKNPSVIDASVILEHYKKFKFLPTESLLSEILYYISEKKLFPSIPESETFFYEKNPITNMRNISEFLEIYAQCQSWQEFIDILEYDRILKQMDNIKRSYPNCLPLAETLISINPQYRETFVNQAQKLKHLFPNISIYSIITDLHSSKSQCPEQILKKIYNPVYFLPSYRNIKGALLQKLLEMREEDLSRILRFVESHSLKDHSFILKLSAYPSTEWTNRLGIEESEQIRKLEQDLQRKSILYNIWNWLTFPFGMIQAWYYNPNIPIAD